MHIQKGFCSAFRHPFHAGFTVIEFAVTLVMVGIGLAAAIPALQSFSANNQVTAASNAIVTGMNLARASAITIGEDITICPSGDGSSCANDNWNGGWIVFNDVNSNGTAESAELIRLFTLSGDLAHSGFGNPIVFRSDGTTTLGADATITNCYVNPTISDHCVAISVNTFGMIQSSATHGESVSDPVESTTS